LNTLKRKRAGCKLQPERPNVPGALGPPSWRRGAAMHREVLNISLDPPRNEPDITQIKKIRQCVFAAKYFTSEIEGGTVAI
jgi:hypothetical protein